MHWLLYSELHTAHNSKHFTHLYSKHLFRDEIVCLGEKFHSVEKGGAGRKRRPNAWKGRKVLGQNLFMLYHFPLNFLFGTCAESWNAEISVGFVVNS